ncbi:MAG: serine/threonine-protein kinase [Planctomycetaceae bacterium]
MGPHDGEEQNDSGESLRGIQAVGDRFLEELRAGGSPEIGTFLQRFESPDHATVFRLLLSLEVEHRRQSGRTPTVADYLPRFADFQDIVVAVLDDEWSTAEPPGPESSIPLTSEVQTKLPDRLPSVSDINVAYASADEERRGGSRLDTRTLPAALGSPLSPSAHAGETIAGRYTLQTLLGEGGMGQVWAASQREPVRRRVAVKLIKPGMDSRAVIQRFEQERQALAVMNHPGIARILDGGLTDERRPYFVMELVDGQPLTTFCDKQRLGIRERLELFVTICHAVQHAHQKGIVHRDLKPSNILVSLQDGRPVLKVIDFGLAKAIGGGMSDLSLTSQFGAVVGTLEYMSPEQASSSGTDVDTRTDIYSLGVILYELLTGLRPIAAGRLRRAALDEMIRVIRDEEPSRPSTRLSADESLPSLAAVRKIEPSRLTRLLRGDLDWLVMKCLEKQRDRRYETASGLARDVERFLANEAVEARPPSVAYRMQKFLRRNRLPVTASAIILLAVAGGIIGTAWGMMRAERARADADLNRRVADKEEKLSGQLSDYLVRTFESANPVGLEDAGFLRSDARSNEGLARRMLDGGADIVNEYMQDKPLMRARLLDAIGNSYRNLGDWDVADRWLNDSYNIRRQELGEADATTVTGLLSLAHLSRDRGRYSEAERLYRSIISAREALFGTADPAVAEAKSYLAWMLFFQPLSTDGPQFNQETLAEAERLLLEVLDVRQQQNPPDHHNIGITLAALASVKFGQQHQEPAALEYASRAAAEFQLSSKDAEFGRAMLSLILADSHRRAGRFEEAEAIYLKVLDLARQSLGHEHPLVIMQLANLAGLYRKQGDMVNAEKTILEFANLVRPVPAFRSQPVVVDALMQYGDEVRRMRSKEEAESLYREALLYAHERPDGNERNVSNFKNVWRLRRMNNPTEPVSRPS